MTDFIRDYLPYTYARSGEEGYHVDVKGILQALVAASITSAVVMYGAQQSLGAKLDAMNDKLVDVTQSVERIERDFYVPRK